jgi:hypothetical protein
LVLEGIDRILAGLKGFSSMGTANSDENTDFANGEVANAMVNHDPVNLRPLVADVLRNLLEHLQDHRFIGLIVQ